MGALARGLRAGDTSSGAPSAPADVAPSPSPPPPARPARAHRRRRARRGRGAAGGGEAGIEQGPEEDVDEYEEGEEEEAEGDSDEGSSTADEAEADVAIATRRLHAAAAPLPDAPKRNAAEEDEDADAALASPPEPLDLARMVRWLFRWALPRHYTEPFAAHAVIAFCVRNQQVRRVTTQQVALLPSSQRSAVLRCPQCVWK